MDSEAAESSADAGEAMDTSETTSVVAETTTTTTTTSTAAVIIAQSSITPPTASTSSSPSSSSSTSTEPSPLANSNSIIPIATTSSSSYTTTSTTSNSPPVDDRTRELLFLIYRFLETSNFDGVSAALHRELEARRLLPQTSDALTGRPLPMSTVAEVRAEHRHIAGDHLLRLVEQAETAIARVAPPPVAVGVSSLLMGGRFSLLRSLEPADPLRLTVHRNSNSSNNNSMNRYRNTNPSSLISFLANHPNHAPVVPSARFTTGAHPGHLLPALISRELSGPKPVTALWPVGCYERYDRYKRILGHLSSVYCVSFDRTGQYIFTGADDRLVKVWSAVDGRLLTTLRGHEEEITDMTVDYDNSMLATASCDKIIRVWCLKSTAPLAILTSHSATITGLKFCPLMKSAEKRYLVSCSNDGSVCFWEYNALTRKFKGMLSLLPFPISKTLPLSPHQNTRPSLWSGSGRGRTSSA